MKYFFCLLLMFGFASCKKTDVEEVKVEVADKLSLALAKGLECSQQEIIKQDILKVFDLKIEQGEQANPIAQTVCKYAVGTGLPIILKAGVPKTWDCKLEMANVGIKAIAENACSAL